MPGKPAGPAPVAPDPLAQFTGLSAALTGYDAAELWGTGMVRTYYATLSSIVGESLTARLLSAWAAARHNAAGDPGVLEAGILNGILADPALGPLARNLITLWYMGQWNQLPADWRNQYGANARDETFIVSPDAYVQGLVWDAIHSHPQGAKQPGYGSWALPPKGAGA